MKALLAAAALFAASLPAGAAELPIPIVAAENFYGEVAAAVGGDRVTVESVIVAPGVDPHDFEPAPSTARLVADARVVVMNGADYDHWMERLVEGSAATDQTVIDVASLLGVAEGANPHLWYDLRAVPALAEALAKDLAAIDPEGAEGYASRAKDFVASLEKLNQKVADIRGRFAGVPVTASEPVFGLMAEALGLEMRNVAVQNAVMHETEPSAKDIAAMEDDLRNGRVRVFFYNRQVVDPLTEQLLAAAAAGKVPVVGVTETKPDGMTYAEWMLGTLDETAKALGDAVLLSAIALDHVTLAVGGATVLNDISLAIEAGEFVGVLGPNGSGKTTIMRAILGLIRPVSGRIEVLGRPAERGNPTIGYLPQTRSAPPAARLSGYDFLASSINGHRFGLPWLSAADRDAIDTAIAQVGGGALAGRPLGSLSGGERQRLLIAEALIGSPKLLVLDEPLIGLDPRQQHVVVDLVRRLSRELGLTVLFSAHELNQLLGAVDRILYLGHGRAALGTVDEVIRPDVLSPLFGAPIQVLRAGGRVFVLSEGAEIERSHGHHGHDHAHL